ncbi:MAG: PAS domain S-box protein [Rhodospirillales bacterium]|nr:PAS domain S-box protein [Rhodospirillales bacterium]
MSHQFVDLILVLTAFLALGGWVWFARRHHADEDRQRKQTQAQHRFQAMVEDQTNLICRSDGDGNRLFVNDAYCRFFNRTREELIGTPIGSFLSDEDARRLHLRISGLHPKSPIMGFENAVKRPDGVERWHYWNHTGIFDAQGRLVELNSVGRDITERKGSDEALKESEKRLRLFTDAMPALFCYIDKDRRYRFCNLHFEKFFHKKRDQIIGKTMEENLGPYTYQQVQPAIDKVLAGENVFYEQWVDYREAGNTFVRGSLIPDYSENGEVKGFFAMVQDMTAKKYAEDSLAKAKERAEETSASKTRFLAAASHDLRQPMQALAMFIDVLAGRRHDKDSQEIIEKIQASSKALEVLLNSLLDISKLEADLVVPAFRRFTLSDLTSRLADEIRPMAERKGLKLVHVPSQLRVRSDPGLLDRILRNFLTNAIAHTENGRILFGCRRRGGKVRIEVWDTGSGIPDSQKELIFEEFYKIQDQAVNRREGLGLGLAIVERLAKILNHRIELDSEVGKGSVFRVRVPIIEPLEATKGEPSADLAALSNGALVVGIDDDPQVRDALSLLLESWGFEVVTAASEQEAVTRLSTSKRTPDLVIADYRLQQGGTGSSAINAIRRHWGGEIPGLLLTGATDPKGLEEASASGFPVVQKPIMPENLKAVVAEQMEPSEQVPKKDKKKKSAAADT